MDNEQLMYSLQRELEPFKPFLAQASDVILDQEVSGYPIFVVCEHLVEVGVPLPETPAGAGKWLVNVSMLEEFTAKQIVKMERLDHFKGIYKDPQCHFCLFVLSEMGATFIFMPR